MAAARALATAHANYARAEAVFHTARLAYCKASGEIEREITALRNKSAALHADLMATATKEAELANAAVRAARKAFEEVATATAQAPQPGM